MSSHTEPAQDHVVRRTRRAVVWARTAPYLGWVAAALGAVFVVYFVLQAGLLQVLSPPQPEVPDVGNPTDVTSYGLKFTGFDKDNKPYSVAAKSGRQDDANKDLMYLDQMVAQFSNAAGNLYDISAKQGIYNKKDGSMDMKGDVLLTQGKRFTARMAEARAIIKTKSLSTKSDVTVNFADTTIQAHGMEISDDGNRIQFFNGVTSHFGPKAQ